MFKRFSALFALTAMLTLIIGTSFVMAEPVENNTEQPEQLQEDQSAPANDFSEPTVPRLHITLNPDGTTTTIFSQEMSDEELAQTLPFAEQSFTSMGYTVTQTDNPTSLSISKQNDVEEGYVLDFNVPFNAGLHEFVEFKEFFSSRYGIKNSLFNLEGQPEGQDFLIITINTSVKPIYSNAQVISNGGKTNVWHISSGQKNLIQLNFKKINIIPVVSVIFIAAVLLILIFALMKNRKDNDSLLSSDAEDVSEDLPFTQEELEHFEESDEYETEELELDEVLEEVAEEAGLDLSEETEEPEENSGAEDTLTDSDEGNIFER